MSFDLIVKSATLVDGRVVDIGVNGEKIAAIEQRLDADAAKTIDATGNLVSSPFVDPHFHMDATLSYGIPRINASGTLLEGIALWGELKPLLTHEAVKQRALSYCDWAVSMGLLAIRTHVDVCDDRLLAVEALLEVKKEVAPYIDLQLVAFPQDRNRATSSSWPMKRSGSACKDELRVHTSPRCTRWTTITFPSCCR
jgi:cytosine deaminase